MAEPERRRRRPPISCSLCRRRKIRCNRETPCSNCVRSRNVTCVYENHLSIPSRPAKQHLSQGQTTGFGLENRSRESIPIDRASSTSRESTVLSHPSSSRVTSSTSSSTRPSQLPDLDVESMKSRIRQLEEQLTKANLRSIQVPAPTSNSNIETTTSRTGGTFHVHSENRMAGHQQAITRSVTHKKRLLGKSHWISGVMMVRDLWEIMESSPREDVSKAISDLQKCKSLARVIKSRWAPPWPSPPTPDLPPKDVADELVDYYLRTTEAIYRILHVPAFRRDYDTLWVSDTAPDTPFLVQLKLVLAIGAVTYDDQFSLRVSAIRWVYEAQTWLSEPKFKSRLGIQSLQTHILLLLAEEIVGIGGDPMWISAGALLRKAISMGLHRDPAHLPKLTTFATEMQRRLWNTIMEINLQSSMTTGGSPLIYLEDFDTKPPGNFDDDQLEAEDPVPKLENNFTQVTIAIALRKTFPIRLAISKFLNDLSSDGTYEETLRLNAELKAAYQALCRYLQACSSGTGPSPSRFEIRAVDFIMHRYLSSLHIPFFDLALRETAYAFSKKVVVETSLKIWYAAYPARCRSDTATSDRDDLVRLALCGSGFYRSVAMQAAVLIAVELRTQLQEEESLSPVSLRPDLVSVLEDAKCWCLQAIEAGETNIKGYWLMCGLAAQIEGLTRGLGKAEMADFLVKTAEDANEKCLPILEKMVAQSQPEGTTDVLHQIPWNTQPGEMEDWDFLMSDAIFNTDNAEPISWMFNDETTQGVPLW